MKKNLLLTAALTVLTVVSQANAQAWQAIPMPPGFTSDSVRDIKYSAGVLYASFQSMGLWKTSDGGAHWTNIQYNEPANSNGGYFGFNKQGDLLFVPNEAATRGVYRLPVGATSWSTAAINWSGWNGSHYPARVVMNTAGDIIAVSSAQDIIRSTDGGQTFGSITSSLTGVALFDVKTNPLNANELAIGNETGPEHISYDGGLTWSDIGQSGGNVRLGYNRFGQLFGSATHDAAGKGWVYARYTGGTTWVQSDVGLPLYGDTRSSALAANGAFYAGGSSSVYVSADNGADWTLAGANLPVGQIPCLAIGSDGYSYAGAPGGASGAIWRLPLVATPEPATLAMLALGGLAILRRKRN